MSNFLSAAIFAFAAIICFFSVNSAVADKKKIGWLFIVTGIVLALFCGFFIYKAYVG